MRCGDCCVAKDHLKLSVRRAFDDAQYALDLVGQLPGIWKERSVPSPIAVWLHPSPAQWPTAAPSHRFRQDSGWSEP